jgi:thymidylate synthase (FAD)
VSKNTSAGTAGTSLYNDSWHRPHADHNGQVPSVLLSDGPGGLRVSLDQWGPQGTALATIYNQAVSNWGETPSYVEYDYELTPEQMKVVEAILDGKHLSNALEAVSFSFTINGCTRACTHELVRTRVGASYAQHGGRDNDWRHRRWTIPETINRMNGDTAKGTAFLQDFQRYLSDLGVNLIDLDVVTEQMTEPRAAERVLRMVLAMEKAYYAASVDNGIPWQDARRILGIGHQTYIHANYNYLALKGVTAHRLEHGAVDWEIDCVAQLMVREVYLKCPRVLAKRLRSHSDASGVNKFATLYSWPPNQKHPEPKDYDATKPTQFTRCRSGCWTRSALSTPATP